MNTLIIDTSDNKEIIVGLKIDNKEFIKKKKVDTSKSQTTLPLISEILSERRIKLEDLDSIEVNTVPGSFTGIRVGVAIANTLSYSLKIPVNGNKPGVFAYASYK